MGARSCVQPRQARLRRSETFRQTGYSRRAHNRARGRTRFLAEDLTGSAMPDVFTKAKRSEVMSRIKSRDTRPERAVRSMLHRLGYRFRLHRADLPGKPDLVLSRYRTVVFVHGCFWHRHKGCRLAYTPKTRVD